MRVKLESRILAIVLLGAWLFSFQNCTNGGGISFQSVSQLGLKSGVQQGNGSGYEGKPEGEFYRRLPSQVCAKTVLSKVTFPPITTNTSNSATGITLQSINPEDCTETNETIDISRVSYSRLQQKVISVDDGVYEKLTPEELSVATSSETISLPEVWCQSPQGRDTAIDIVVKRNTVNQFGDVSVKIGSQMLSNIQIETLNTFQAARAFKSRELTYTSPAFNLRIDTRATQTSGRGDYSATVSLTSNGQDHSESLTCRLGSELDGAIWPSLLLGKEQIEQIYWFKDGDRILYSAKNSEGTTELFYKQTSELFLQKVSPQVIGARYGVRDFKVSQDETQVLVAADYDLPYAYQLYGFYLASANDWKRISDTVTNPAYSVDQSYDFAANGLVVFKASPKTKLTDGDKYFYTAQFDGSSRMQMHPNLGTDEEAQNIVYLPGKSQFLFTEGFAFHFDFAMSNPDGTGHHNLMIQNRLATDEHILWFDNNPIIAADESFFVFKTSKTSTWGHNLYRYDFATNLLTKLYDSSVFEIHLKPSVSGNLILLEEKQPAALKLIDVTNNQIYQLTIEGSLIAYDFLPGGRSAAVQHYVAREEKIHRALFDDHGIKQSDINWNGHPLPGNSPQHPALLKLADGSGEYSFEFNSVSGLTQLRFVSYSTGKTTSLPRSTMATANMRSLTFSRDQTKIIFLADSNSDGEDELYVAYLDGRGISQISDRYQIYGGVATFLVSPDSDRVLFSARKGLAGRSTYFIWDGK